MKIHLNVFSMFSYDYDMSIARIFQIYRKNYIYFTMLYISKYIIINIFIYDIFLKYFFLFWHWHQHLIEQTEWKETSKCIINSNR